jgi:hypothetical protein
MMWAFGAELRALVGPAGSGNARCLKILIAEVADRGLFDELALTEGNSRIHWQFSKCVHEMMASRWLGADFALLDLEKVRACSSLTTFDLYCRVRNLRNHPIPEFELPLESRWCDFRKKFLKNLRQVVIAEDTMAFVGLEWVRRGEGSQRLRVRLRHKGTTWYPDKLRYWARNARVFRVSPYEITEIDGQDLTNYAMSGENSEQVEANLRKNLAASSHL